MKSANDIYRSTKVSKNFPEKTVRARRFPVQIV